MMYHLEYEAKDEEVLHNSCKWVKKMGLFKKFFGQFANYVKNPGEDAGEGKKATWGTMITRHGSINLCTGLVQL